MRSTIFSVLPFVGLAVADSVCEIRTVTKTEYAYQDMTSSTVLSVAVASAPVAYTPMDSTAASSTLGGYSPPAASTPVASAPVVVKEQATPASSTCVRPTVTSTKVEMVTVTVEAGQGTTETIDITRTSTVHSKTTVTVRPSGAPAKSSSAPSAVVSASSAASPAATSATSVLPEFSLANPAQAKATSPAEKPTSSAAATSSAAPAAPKAQQPKSAGTSAAGSKSGEATFYGGNVSGGMCSFTGYTIPSGLFGTALSDSNWAGAQACGQCVQVTGPSGNKVTAMVVDQCPGCGNNHLDLFPDAFAKLADPSKGVINVSWDFVPCGISSPIVLKNKEGTSKFWFSMQVMNANVGVAKLEVSTDGGASWKATTRQPYNFFENSSGFGTDSVDVKVTSIDGKTVVVKGVSIAASSTKTASANF